MLNQPTIDKLLAMRMEPVVEAWRAFEQDENTQALSFEEKLSLMVDRLWTWRQHLALERRMARALREKPVKCSAKRFAHTLS
jgi:hypothetical protein